MVSLVNVLYRVFRHPVAWCCAVKLFVGIGSFCLQNWIVLFFLDHRRTDIDC